MNGSWLVARGSWLVARGSWLVARGSWLVAFVLVVAATLKLTSTKPVVASALSDLIPNYLLTLIPWAELALAGWLASGYCRFGNWLTTSILFSLFAVHTGLLVWAGKPSCGCLGAVDTAPAYTFAFDLAILLVLVVCRPRWAGWPTITPRVRLAVRTAGLAAVIVCAAAGWAYQRYGSVDAAISVARGEPVSLVHSSVNLGAVPTGQPVTRILSVRNNTTDDVQIAYVESSCDCAEVQGLPILIPAESTVNVILAVNVSRKPGNFRQAGRLHTSAGTLQYTITGTVVAPLSEDGP